MEATWITCLVRRIVAGAIWREPTKIDAFAFSLGLVTLSYVVDKERCKKHTHKNHTHKQTQPEKIRRIREQLHFYAYSAHFSLGPHHHHLGALLTKSWECSLMCIRNPTHCLLRSQS
jgi:hypothetical protein